MSISLAVQMDTLRSWQATPDSLASTVHKNYHQKWFQSQCNLSPGIYVRHLNSCSMWLAKFWRWKGHHTGPINRKRLREKSAETNHYYGHCIRVAGLGRWLACLDVLCFYPSVIKQGQREKTPSNLLVPQRPKIPDNSSGMITAAGWDQETFQPRALRENVKPSTQTTGAGAERRKFSNFSRGHEKLQSNWMSYSHINCENKPGFKATVVHYTTDRGAELVNKVFSMLLINLLCVKGWNFAAAYYACVRRSDVSPVAVAVRKGPRAAGPRQTLFNSDVTTSRPGVGGSGGVWEGGKKHRSAKLYDKGQKKSRPTIAGVNPQSKPPQLTQLCATVIVCWLDQQTR